jgi:hypothetical protein
MADTKDRMQRLRARRIAQGERPVELWLDPESHQRLLRLSDLTRDPFKQVIQVALAVLEAQGHVHTPPPPPSALSDALSDTPERTSALPTAGMSYEQRKAAVIQWIRARKNEGLSLQTIANRLNAEGIPTLTGRGSWQKGTVGNLLAQEDK